MYIKMQVITEKLLSYFKIKSNVAALSSLLILSIALSDYQLAKLGQRLLLFLLPNFSYIWSLSLPWLMIGVAPILACRSDIFVVDFSYVRKNIKQVFAYTLLVIAGLTLFVGLGVTSYFHSVKYPFIFFIITPIAEEMIFRGWMYDWSSKIIKLNPVLITAIFFGLHHWQYFDYRITPFAVFQIGYTFMLGLLFGEIRKKSKTIYLSVLLHVLINYVSYSF